MVGGGWTALKTGLVRSRELGGQGAGGSSRDLFFFGNSVRSVTALTATEQVRNMRPHMGGTSSARADRRCVYDVHRR